LWILKSTELDIQLHNGAGQNKSCTLSQNVPGGTNSANKRNSYRQNVPMEYFEVLAFFIN
jgi:hypothetical protein